MDPPHFSIGVIKAITLIDPSKAAEPRHYQPRKPHPFIPNLHHKRVVHPSQTPLSPAGTSPRKASAFGRERRCRWKMESRSASDRELRGVLQQRPPKQRHRLHHTEGRAGGASAGNPRGTRPQAGSRQTAASESPPAICAKSEVASGPRCRIAVKWIISGLPTIHEGGWGFDKRRRNQRDTDAYRSISSAT